MSIVLPITLIGSWIKRSKFPSFEEIASVVPAICNITVLINVVFKVFTQPVFGNDVFFHLDALLSDLGIGFIAALSIGYIFAFLLSARSIVNLFVVSPNDNPEDKEIVSHNSETTKVITSTSESSTLSTDDKPDR
jgi:hypothetical protein